MSKLRYAYEHLEEFLSSFFLAVMIGSLAIQLVVRATFGGAVSWAEELSRFTFIWAVYIAASFAAKRAAHVRINAQFILMPPKTRLVFRMLADCIWVAFNLFFAIHGMGMVAEAFEFPEISVTLGITKAWVELIIPVAFFLMSWRTVEVYIRNWGNLADLVKIEEGKA
ncbi:MAG: TRAP transporter small permease subunit [Planctomycetes bacterium]|nr:TRAP transporter small permease subunit [Planctomycetota bacterium]